MTNQQIEQEFEDFDVTLFSFSHQQLLDWDGLLGRVCSSSYSPNPDHSDYLPMLATLKELYQTYVQEDTVVFRYQTLCYLCSL
ncbi:MAG: hypothetical protein HOD01_01670 [Oceanospirillaceae bacterium]|jgi:hypothetical protein|nr:hypothetical protein [Oceanospirillaceae bacterium]